MFLQIGSRVNLLVSDFLVWLVLVGCYPIRYRICFGCFVFSSSIIVFGLLLALEINAIMYLLVWLALCLVLLTQQDLLLAVRKGGRRNTNIRGGDILGLLERTREDWMKLSPESLRLACNAISIQATGSRAAVVDRLW